MNRENEIRKRLEIWKTEGDGLFKFPHDVEYLLAENERLRKVLNEVKVLSGLSIGPSNALPIIAEIYMTVRKELED